jgi:serine/threonine protein kinase
MAPTQTGVESAAHPPLPTDQIAPHFPQLEILECLGRGGMGVVYKARQKSLNRFVALKLLAPERVGEPEFAARFSREAHALAALNHPNIVTIYDFGQAGGFYFLLMEFVDGVNLRQLLRLRKFTPEEALTIVPPLCDALQFAHKRGFVHRDIKPENLLLDREGHVKIADFGIAKMLGTADGSGTANPCPAPESATQTALGTPGYSAPEQKTDPQRVDNRADIYSLGVVFYEMLTGELPGSPIEPPSHKVQIDVRLDEVVLRALEMKPERRYQHASQIKTDVETIAGSNAGATPPPAAAWPQHHPRSPSRAAVSASTGTPSASKTTNLATARATMIAGVALLLVAAVVAAVFLAVGDWRVQSKVADSQSAPNHAFANPAHPNSGQPHTLTPAAGLVELKEKWPPGKRYVKSFDLQQDMALLLQGRTNTVQEIVTMGNQYALTVLRETPEGGHELELEYLSARMGTKMGDWTVLDFDSANPKAGDETNGVAAVFRTIVGSKIRYFLNASNVAERLEGVGELVQRIKSVPQTDPFTHDIQNIFNADYFQQCTNANPVLPRQAVQPGDAWTSQVEHAVAGTGIVRLDYKVVFQSWEMHEGRNCARLEFQGIMKVQSDPNSKRDETTYHPRDGVLEGVAWFDPDLGQTVESDLKIDANVDKLPRNAGGTLGAATQMGTITTQRHQVITVKLER